MVWQMSFVWERLNYIGTKTGDAVKKNMESFLAPISFLPVNFCVFNLNIKYLAYVKKRKYIISKLLSYLEYISFILIIPSL